MSYVEIARVDTLSQARVLVTALKAHGFNPREPADGGLPGVTGSGHAVEVPEEEVNDASILARQIAADMRD
jgi:hypothetical protein